MLNTWTTLAQHFDISFMLQQKWIQSVALQATKNRTRFMPLSQILNIVL